MTPKDKMIAVVMVVVVVMCDSALVVKPVRMDVGKQVLVISLDGYGHHYLASHPGTNLPMFFSRGSHPDKFINQFVTKTFPNHWSVATGVYEEVHGVVGNDVYDLQHKTTLSVHNRSFFTQNPDIVPIWTLNEKAGGHSGCIMWPGCFFPYRGTNVTYLEPYQPGTELRTWVDRAVQWLTDTTAPANLIMMYYEQPDTLGHVYGPDSPQLRDELLKIDDAIGYLHQKLAMFELRNEVDVIILSDHGMQEVVEEKIIDLEALTDTTLYFYTGTSPVLNVWPKDEVSELAVYLTLKGPSAANHYRVLTKSSKADTNTLKAWHYYLNPRISPFTLVADDSYVFQDFWGNVEHYKKKGYQDLTKTHGTHGYPVASPNMEPIFVAAGPSFHRGYRAAVNVSNLDVYPLLCHLLSVTPGPHNGSLAAIGTLLSRPVGTTLIRPLIIALGCTVALVGVVGAVACVLARRDHKRTVSADTLINGYVYRKTMRRDKQTLEDISEEECLLDPEVEEV